MARKSRPPRVKIHEITVENDIRYRGPLTYQHLQILGWLCIVASQAALLLRLGSKLDASVAELYQTLGPALELAADFSLPLLLIANFAQILDFSDGYKNQMIKNAGASLAVFLVSVFFFRRYIISALAALSRNPADAMPALEAILQVISPNGFISFNLFIDLFLCTLVMLFLNYRPKRFFQGKLIHVFRLFALLPIGYEVACMVLKVMSANGQIHLPLWTFPLLTVKPPMTFVLFIILAVFVKIRELRFHRHGKTHADYQEFLKTRKNSWNFSVFLAVMMVVVSLLDLVVLTGYSIVGAVRSVNESAFIAAEEAVSAADPVETAAALPAEKEIAQEEAAAASELDALYAQLTEEEKKELQAFLAMLADPSAGLEAPVDSAETEPLTEEEKAQRERDRIAGAFESALFREISTAEALGFGGSVNMLLLAPLMLLFSYTKTPRSQKAGLAVPLVGMVLIVLLYLEGIRLALWNLPIPKMDISQISSYLWLAVTAMH